MIQKMLRSCSVLCIALTLAPQLSMAGPTSDPMLQEQNVLSALRAKTTLPPLAPQETRQALRSSVAIFEKALSKKTLSDAKAVFPTQVAKTITGPILSGLSKLKPKLVSDSEIQIQTQAGLVRLEAKDMANGKFVLNGVAVSVSDFSTPKALQSEIDRIVISTLQLSPSHVSWSIISSAHAFGLEFVGAAVAILIVLGLNYVSEATGCHEIDVLQSEAKFLSNECRQDEQAMLNNPSSFATSETKSFLNRVQNLKLMRSLDERDEFKRRGQIVLNLKEGDMPQLEKQNYWRTAETLFMQKVSCKTDGLLGNVKSLSACLSRVKAKAADLEKAQAQTTLKNKPIKFGIVGSSPDDSRSPAASNRAQ